MLFDLVITLTGLFVLVVGGDFMVRGAASLARRFGVSPLAVGLTVVAFGTSAPELAVNVTAAWRGNTGVSFGNIFGSNLANVGLVVAITALVRPLEIQSVVIRRELPMMMLATLAAAVIGLDAILVGRVSEFDRADGLLLLLLFTVFIYYTIGDVLSQRQIALAAHQLEQERDVRVLGVPVSLALTGLGITLLLVGARFTVVGAVDLARAFGVSETIIGLTLIAVGTSLPELAASLVATARGQVDLAIGNAVGSNVFNVLLVLGVTSTIRPIEVPVGGGADIAVAAVLGLMLWAASLTSNRTIIRAEAAVLLAAYLAYITQRAVVG